MDSDWELSVKSEREVVYSKVRRECSKGFSKKEERRQEGQWQGHNDGIQYGRQHSPSKDESPLSY